jgi:hypothetical protein
MSNSTSIEDNTINIKRLVDAATALVDSLSHDEHGTMIGGKFQGGNGGLISKQTITLADEVRRAINSLKEP